MAADLYYRALSATEHMFEAYLILILDLYPRAVKRLQRMHTIRGTSLRTAQEENDRLSEPRDSGTRRSKCEDDGRHTDQKGNTHDTSPLRPDTVDFHIRSMSASLWNVQRDLNLDTSESQQREKAYRERGAELSLACGDGGHSKLVDAIFGVLPLMLRVSSSRPGKGIVRALQREEPEQLSGGKTATRGMPLLFPAVTSLSAISSQTIAPLAAPADNGSVHDSLRRSYVVPFLDGGRWQVAIFWPAGRRVLVDPWGLDGSRPPLVGKDPIYCGVGRRSDSPVSRSCSHVSNMPRIFATALGHHPAIEMSAQALTENSYSPYAFPRDLPRGCDRTVLC